MEQDLSVASRYESIRRRIRPSLGDGTTAMLSLQLFQHFLRIGSSLILTRLLAPEQYGVVGIVNSIAFVLQLISDMGLTMYIVRHANARPELLQTVWTVRLIRNASLTAIMFLGADIFAGLYNAPEVAPAIRVCAFLFLLDSLASLSYMLAQRNRAVIRVSALEFVNFLFTTTVAIVAAYFMHSYWAIIVSMFARSLFTILTSYFLLRGPKIRLRFQRDHFDDLWGYWRYIIPSSLITIFLTQAGVFLVAHSFSLIELGLYSLASNLIVTAGRFWKNYIIRVFAPRFSQAHREGTEPEIDVYYASRRQISMLYAFGVGGLIGGGELLIKILFNNQYLGAGLFLSILGWKQLALVATTPAEQAVIIRGFLGMSLTVNSTRLVWAGVAGTAAYFLIGPIAALFAVCLAEMALLPLVYYQLHQHKLLRPMQEILVWGCAAAGIAIGFGAYKAALALISAGIIPDF